jgi:iron complex outermembrane receptor protein
MRFVASPLIQFPYFCAPMRKILLPAFLFISLAILAQTPGPNPGRMDTAALNRMPKIGKVLGIIKDSVSGKVVDYASVALLRMPDSAVAGGSVTNARGEFLMENLGMGRYMIVITSVGYRKYFSRSFFLMPNKPETNLGAVLINPSSRQVKEVQVDANRQEVLRSIDKTTYIVGTNLVNTGGTATELLQNVPGVSVDIDGNISLRGNANVTVLVDGKPSAITGGSKASILSQFPAGSIERIEVISNPGAKYDAEGMAGIINIILKKDKLKGFNLNASVGTGTHDKYPASIGMNYRVKKFNFYTNYNYRSEARWWNSWSNRQNHYSINGRDTAFNVNNSGSGINNSFNHLAKAGVDWYINNSNSMGISATLNSRKENSRGSLDYIYEDAFETATKKEFRESSTYDKNASIELNTDYRHIFKNPKNDLTASASFSRWLRISDASYSNFNRNMNSNELLDNFLDQKNNMEGDFTFYTFQSDYSQAADKGKIETGIKSTGRFSTSLNDAFIYNESKKQYENDTLFTRHFDYTDQVHAAYFQYSAAFKKIIYQAGLRAELSHVSGTSLISQEKFEFNYPGLFPSATVKYNYSKTIDLIISYSRRVNRPDIRALMPFKEYEDRLNYRVGNPMLKPENINSYEFSCYKTWKESSLGGTLYYRHTINMITRFRMLDTLTGITIGVFQNFSTSDNTGIELVHKSTLFKILQLNLSGNVFRNVIHGENVDASLQSTSFNWNTRGSISGRLTKTFTFQFTGFYMAPVVQPQGVFQGMSGVDFGTKYDFWKNAASLTFNISDIFNTRHFEVTNDVYGFTMQNYRKRETRIAMLTLSYKFGSQNEQQRFRKRQDQNNNDQRMDDF